MSADQIEPPTVSTVGALRARLPRRRVLQLVGVAAVAAGVRPRAAGALDDPDPGEAFVVYNYDFADGQLPPGWSSSGTQNSAWQVLADPDVPGNSVLARISPAPDPSSADAKAYTYAFGKSSWADYVIELTVKSRTLPDSGHQDSFGIAARLDAAGTSARRLVISRKASDGTLTYQALTGAGAFYAARPTTEHDAERPRTLLARLDGTRNYYAVDGPVSVDPAALHTPAAYRMPEANEVLSPAVNPSKYDDADQDPHLLPAAGPVGVVEQRAWAAYDQITLRVREQVSGLEVHADDATDLSAPLEPSRFYPLSVLADVLAPFDGVGQRPVDPSLSELTWTLSDPTAATVTDRGELVTLSANAATSVTVALADAPQISTTLAITTGAGEEYLPLRDITIEDVGTSVSGGRIRLMPRDTADLGRMVKVHGNFLGQTLDLSGAVTFDVSAGDAAKATVTGDLLSLTSQAHEGDDIALTVRYAYHGHDYTAPLTVQVAPQIDVDALSFAPFNGYVFLGQTLNLDGAAAAVTGNQAMEFGDVSGLVTWTIKTGADVATLAGSVLALKPAAQPRDSIVVAASYLAHNAGGDTLVTNEFNVEVADVVSTGGGDVYDIMNTNGYSSPAYVLQALQIEQGPLVVDTVPLLKWQTLNLRRDVRVRGRYDVLRGETVLTAATTWSIVDDPAGLAAIVDVGGEPVLQFADDGAMSAEGAVVLQADVDGVSTTLTVIGLVAEALLVEPARVDLVPGETVNPAEHIRPVITAEHDGVTYRLDARAMVTWTAGGLLRTRLRIADGVLSHTLVAGEDADLVATYTHDSRLKATVSLHGVDASAVAIDTSALTAYSHNAIGFNDSRFGYNTTLYTDAGLEALIQPTAPAFLRFPAGGYGSYLRWEIDGFIPETLKHTAHGTATYNAYQAMLDDPVTGGKISVLDFLAYCADVGAEPVIQLNLYSADVDSAVALLQHCHAAGHHPTYWELDNELYFDGGAGFPFRVGFPGPDDYIRKAKEFAAALRAADPSIKIITLAGWHKTINRQGPNSRFMNSWAAKVAAEDYYDLVQEHWYLAGAVSASAPYRDKVREAFTHPAYAIGELSRYAANRFGSTPLAVTEWGMEDANGLELRNTLANVLYDADCLLNFIKYDNIAMATRYLLVGGGFAVIGFEGAASDATHLPVTRAPYHAFTLLADLFGQTDRRGDPPRGYGKRLCPDVFGDPTVPVLSVTAFADSATGAVHLAVVNKDDVDHPLAITVDGQPHTGSAVVTHITADTITGDDGDTIYTLMRNNGGVKYTGDDFLAPIPTDDTQYVQTHRAEVNAGEPIVIPRYSVAVVDLDA